IAVYSLFFAVIAVYAQTPPPDTGLTANPVFEKNCAKCHGKTGEGRHFGGPPLVSEKTAAASTDDLRNIITNGKGRMPKYASKLTSEEIDTLVQQINALNKKSTAEVPAVLGAGRESGLPHDIASDPCELRHRRGGYDHDCRVLAFWKSCHPIPRCRSTGRLPSSPEARAALARRPSACSFAPERGSSSITRVRNPKHSGSSRNAEPIYVMRGAPISLAQRKRNP